MKVYIEMDCDIDYAARDFDACPNDRDYVSRVFASKEAAKAHGLKKKEIDKLVEMEVLHAPASSPSVTELDLAHNERMEELVWKDANPSKPE